MTDFKKSTIRFFCIIIISAQVYTVITYSKLWPFYSMTMFSEVQFPFRFVKGVFVDVTGAEHNSITEWTFPFGYFRFNRIILDIALERSTNKTAGNEILKDLMERYAAKVQINPNLPRFESFRLYICNMCSNSNENWTLLSEVPITYADTCH